MTFEYGPFVYPPNNLDSAKPITPQSPPVAPQGIIRLGEIGPVYEIEVPFPHDDSQVFLHVAVGNFDNPSETGISRYDQLVGAIGDGEEMLMRRISSKELRRLKRQPTLPLAPGSNLMGINLKNKF